jgi:hypothetical protein
MLIKKRRQGLKKSGRHQEHLKSGMKKDNPIVNEQKKHLRRIARLRRLGTIARDTDNMAIAVKVRALMEKERHRHERAMEKLQAPGKNNPTKKEQSS